MCADEGREETVCEYSLRAARRALETLSRALESSDEMVAVAAAEAILNHAERICSFSRSEGR